MAITTKTIFTNSLPEMEKGIIFFSDNESLVSLSGVNKHANETLSNLFFKARFNYQHPILRDKDFEFKKLCGYFPGNCWKITCCAFSKGNLHLSQAFILEQAPNIHKYIQSQEEAHNIELRKICGSFYQDPNSPIDKAWKAMEFLNENEDPYTLYNNYFELENRRISCTYQLENAKRTLKAFDPSGKIILTHIIGSSDFPQSSHKLEMDEQVYVFLNGLQIEFLQAQSVENVHSLKKCTSLIQKLINNPEKASTDAFEKIRQMINSCDCNCMNNIWGALYRECANEVHEDQWSEKHFNEFLGPLLGIVKGEVFHQECMANFNTNPTIETN